jgi:glycosyltransferase involved in cell wall biosynthesis
MDEDRLERNSLGNWSASADCPSCSVVICTRDRPEYLERCLNGLASVDYPRFEVLVVDNAPSDGRARKTAARWDTRYTVEPIPGLSRARNRGLLESQSEIVAYLDDDAVAQRGWLSGLAAEFNDPVVIAVSGRVIPFKVASDEEGKLWAAITERGLVRHSFDRQTADWFVAANFGAIGIGANMGLRRSVLGIWPGFDVRLGRGVWRGVARTITRFTS